MPTEICMYALEGVALRVREHADVGVAVDDAREDTGEPPVASPQQKAVRLQAARRD